MRLVLVNSSLRWCGVDQVCLVIAEGMRARGHDVLNVVRVASDYQRAMDDAGLPWIEGPRRSPGSTIREWRRYLADLRDFRADVTHIHTGRDWGTAILLPRSAASVLVATRHNGYPLGRLKARIYGSRFQRIFAVSRFVARVLTEEDGVPREHVRVLPNPLRLEMDVDRATAGKRFFDQVVRARDPGLATEDKQPFRVGYIGRYTRAKGIAVVHEIAKGLAGETDFRLYTAGRPGGDDDRSLMAELARETPPNLLDLGFVTDVAGFYSFVDVTIMPSTPGLREAAGLTALEGQGAGTPIIAGNSGAIPEAVVHGETGLVVEDNDVDTFLRHIRELRDQPDLLERMSRAGREHARKWEAEVVLDDHEKAYLDLTELAT